MPFELILVAAFALFAVFAWLRISDLAEKVDLYRDQRDHYEEYAADMEEQAFQAAMRNCWLEHENEIINVNRDGLVRDNQRLREQVYGAGPCSRN